MNNEDIYEDMKKDISSLKREVENYDDQYSHALYVAVIDPAKLQDDLEKLPDPDLSLKSFRESLKNIYKKYHPELGVDIDTYVPFMELNLRLGDDSKPLIRTVYGMYMYDDKYFRHTTWHRRR